jgi:hypothetical protein
MKLSVADFASLISGTTVIINDCSIQLIVGAPLREGEESEVDTHMDGIGFMAHLPEEEEFEEEIPDEEEEVPEDGEPVCRKSVTAKKSRSRKA